MAKHTSGPTVVLVGRPNVGKSTLFNRITGVRRSIVAPIAGTTRDAIQEPAEWQQNRFQLVDTGGLFGATTDPLHHLVVSHGLKYLKAADLIVFVLDAREGLVPGDLEIATALRRLNKPVILAVNKTDDRKAARNTSEFHQLGFDPVLEIAAEHGSGVAELLDEIKARFPESTLSEADAAIEDGDVVEVFDELDDAADEPGERGAGAGVTDADHDDDDDVAEPNRLIVPPMPDEVPVAIVGRPNVGKSSLVNRLLREERMVVSDMPGTTRDAVDVVLRWHKQKFRLVDTAGMRRPGKVKEGGQIEAVSVLIAKRAMTQAQVAVLVLDAVEGPTDRDAAIAGEAQTLGLSLIIAVNKWDLVKGRDQQWVKDFDDKLRFHMKFLDYAPLLHISAMTGDRTGRVLQTIARIAEARRKKVSTSRLNKFIERVARTHPPSAKGKKDVRILYATQTAIEPPEFVIFTNVATELHFSYERFLTNQLREEFGFEGSPIRLKVKRRAKKGRPE
jgi:GTP-binding protein